MGSSFGGSKSSTCSTSSLAVSLFPFLVFGCLLRQLPTTLEGSSQHWKEVFQEDWHRAWLILMATSFRYLNLLQMPQMLLFQVQPIDHQYLSTYMISTVISGSKYHLMTVP